MRYTLLLVSLTTLSYFIFSSGAPYIPNDLVFSFGFSKDNLAGALSYPFLHISLTHLISNMALLLAIGIVIEEKIKWKDYYAIYLLSAVFSGFAFILLTGNIVLVGASSAIGGLLIPACLIDFKKTLAYVLVFSVIAVLIAQPLNSLVSDSYNFLKERGHELNTAYSQAVEQKTEVEQNLSELDDKFNRGEVDITQYNQTKQQLVEQAENLTRQQQAVAENLTRITVTVSNLEEGIKREQSSQTSMIVHVVGSLVGLVYIAAFRCEILWNSGSQVLKLERWLRRCLRRSRRRT